MPVTCPACQTENRDSAMFCHGCARKLPNFTPTQPSMLETMRAMPSRPVVSTSAVATPVEIEPRSLIGLWVGAGMAVLLLVASIGTWYAHLLRKPAASTAVTAPVARPQAVAAQKPPTPTPTPEIVSLGASLAPGEAAIPPGQVAAPGPAPAARPADESPPSAATSSSTAMPAPT
ncbi:MAG: zinc ribbon domain-containing protein, partial [Variovorax sp.]|nr:zinc ribbon domain-containing protein [Variovorax sp.]